MIEDILIAGLHDTGASIALALTQAEFGQTRTGYDADSQWVRSARKCGAIQRQGLHLERASQRADLVILTVSAAEAQDYLEVMVPQLKPGALLLDLASCKSQVAAWVADNLGPNRAYIAAALAVSPAKLHGLSPDPPPPQADRFQNGLMALAIPARTPEASVELALAVAHHLGATPFFLDPGEIDAVVATVEHLPALLGAALMRIAVGTPGWREARRLAGQEFASVALAGAVQPPMQLLASLHLNRANIVHRLDALLEELSEWRSMLADDARAEELATRLSHAIQVHDEWLAARRRSDWAREEQGTVELPERSGFIDRMLGIRQPLRPKDRR